MKMSKSLAKNYVICVSNSGYKVSLVVRKLYETVPDSEAEKRGLLRVIDESGEDYLFPQNLFASIELPKDVREKIAG